MVKLLKQTHHFKKKREHSVATVRRLKITQKKCKKDQKTSPKFSMKKLKSK